MIPFELILGRIKKDIDTGGKTKGGFRKIADAPRQQLCGDREHNPPGYISLAPGTYEYTCPSCGHKQIINIPLISM
jgi:hypothetical protein